MLVYTTRVNPFTIGGKKNDIVATNIYEYQRVPLGKGFFGLLVKNPYLRMHHIFEETSGALIGTENTKKKVIESVKKDVEEGDQEEMRKQCEDRKRDTYDIMLSPKQFFSRFNPHKDTNVRKTSTSSKNIKKEKK